MSTGSLEYADAELVASMGETNAKRTDGLPFCVVLPGDWSGRVNRGLFASSAELADWRPLLVDRDNLDQVIERLGVKLQLTLHAHQSSSLTIDFKQLADFHPDRLSERLEIFESLRRTRAQLSNPKTFAAAASEVRSWADLPSHDPSPEAVNKESDAQEPPQTKSRPLPGGDLLDQILDSTSTETSAPKGVPRPTPVSPEISELARAAVQPYLSPNIEADQEQMIAAVDARIADYLRAIMHHPDFQALESAWRAVDFLVTRLETGTELKLYLLDISFEEIKADLRSEADVRSTALYNLLVEQTINTPGGIPWSVIAGNYTFDFASGDPAFIERLSLVAKDAGAPFIASSTAHLLGCESLSQTPDPDDWQHSLDPQIEAWWESLKAMPSAAYIGFGLPRFLLRLPYGEETDPTEDINFEEMPEAEENVAAGVSRHESYLWANPTFAIAFLLAKGFSEYGWNFRPSDSMEIEGLPLHVYKRDGDSQIQPCAEVLLTVRAANKIIDRGLMPLLSLKNSDTIRLGMFQSIAGGRLAGPWDQAS
ncbi:MAG: type VI secretion system contractile sheath domain-containing protein [Pyrinomonadaceae bacterium]